MNYVHICNNVKCICGCEYCSNCCNGCPQCKRGEMQVIITTTGNTEPVFTTPPTKP